MGESQNWLHDFRESHHSLCGSSSSACYFFLLYKYQWNTSWAFARKLDIFTWENNMLSPKNYLSEMILYFIGVYIINRTLHGRLEIRNFSSRVEKYFTRSRTLEEKFRISARPCNILYLSGPARGEVGYQYTRYFAPKIPIYLKIVNCVILNT